jgi:hypothetical protein
MLKKSKKIQILYLLIGIFLIVDSAFITFFISQKSKQTTNANSEESSILQYFTQPTDQLAYQQFALNNIKTDITQQHTAAHLFGKALYNKIGFSGIGVCDDQFSFGCFHGFLVEALMKDGTSVIKTLDQECQKKFPDNWTGCQHGIGHGILEYLGHTNLMKALDLCQEINPEKLQGCKGGVFMEYNLPMIFNGTSLNNQQRTIDPQEPLKPCPTLAKIYRYACYYEISQLLEYHYSYEKLGEICQTITDSEEMIDCFKGIGHIAVIKAQFSIDEIIQLCQKMPTQIGVINCEAQASEGYTDFNKQLAPLICKNLSQEDKKLCFPI